jgi:Epoxide hydrolase N terminus
LLILDSSDVKRLTTYWKNGFDWKKQEAKLNEHPQVKTKVEVDGFGEVDMHFIHQKSEVADAIPLLFVHGYKCLSTTHMLS